ncbi:Glutathione-specific gamma-glutamylcyclotransferase [Alphaproteobacteria bacterium SO-S41]|nr:Glutathione-specific gamma-glutamylcyclotransferase [Alphaproteobacteria bacterium SO-S41]
MSDEKPSLPPDIDRSRLPFQRGEDGLLKREEFTAERVAYLTEQVHKSGLWKFISNEDREASRRATLARHPAGTDLWIFGYGSLMWNPALKVTESRTARITGYARNFCLTLILGRAMPDKPGLMLAIEPGEGLTGIVHRIDSDHVESETEILWMREMLSGAYIPVWVDCETDDGPVAAVTFVIDKTHQRYAGEVPLAEQARRIATAEGQAGNNRDYLYRCRGELQRMGVDDPYVEALFSAVTKLTGETGDPL